MDLEAVCGVVDRPAAALTRRDVARALLAEPADEALVGLPALRRELFAAGNPLSTAFWDSVEPMLSSIRRGQATVGDVNSWLGATGTEPIDLLELGVVWPERDEAGPVATEVHALLVAHLESLVADGTIDPDLLVRGDAAAISAHRRLQADWLTTPLPDGRIPQVAIEDEEDEALFAAWDEADREAREFLTRALDGIGDRPCPAIELRAAAVRLRTELRSDRRGTALLRAAAGVDPKNLPEDDAELWLILAAGVVAQRDEPPRTEYDLETLSAWATLEHADWIAAAVILARSGPGSEVEADHLAGLIANFDFEQLGEDLADEAGPAGPAGGPADDEDAWLDVDPDDPWLDVDPDDARPVLTLGLFPVIRLWRQVGALDHDDRLTELGWWGIPESVRRAWRPSESDAQP